MCLKIMGGGGGAKAPPGPPEINPGWCRYDRGLICAFDHLKLCQIKSIHYQSRRESIVIAVYCVETQTAKSNDHNMCIK